MSADQTAPKTSATPVGGIAEFDAFVVGAGFAGMYALYRLREMGLSTKVVETGDGVGGTWFWNRYPGARVDSPSMQYSLSFDSDMEQEWLWSEDYSPQPDLLRYANHVADRFELRKDIQFETTVNRATYDESTKRWLIETDKGDQFSAKYFITAAGCLSATNVPGFKGVDTFKGTWYHTSRWPREGVDLTGKRVGIIGTGSTGIQAIPVLAEQAAHLTVFQRTPNFSLPSNNKPMDREFEAEWKRDYAAHRQGARESRVGVEILAFPEQSAHDVSAEERNRRFEAAWGQYAAILGTFTDITTDLGANEYVAEFVRSKIRETVKDQEVAELLSPRDYPIGTKRICIDSNYYETYNRDNVTLVDVKTNPIVELTPDGLRTTAESYDLDVIVFATGFDAVTGPLFRLNITGKDGVELQKKWLDGPRTYLGVATAGFPNLFMITGPQSPSVLSNMTTSIEQHVDWITDAIKYMRANDLDSMEAEVDAEEDWVDHVREVGNSTLYPLANSWYMGSNIPGKPRVFLPYVGGVGTYRIKCDEVAAKEYEGFAFVS
jgi:cation diffusion facilitator CzcD-associated flavoprotein CzcO